MFCFGFFFIQMWLWLIVKSFIFILNLENSIFIQDNDHKESKLGTLPSDFLDPSVSSVCQNVYLSII